MTDNRNARIRVVALDGRLPWDRLPEERTNILTALLIVLLLSALFLVLYLSTPLPPKDLERSSDMPERLARLVMERKQEPPPPPPQPEPEPEQKVEVEEPPPTPEPKPEPPPEKVQQAREKARKELKVFEDSLAGLRDVAPVVASRELRRGGNEAAKIDTSRNLITRRAGSGSGGISVGEVSDRGGGGTVLGEGSIAEVTSDIAQSTAPTKKSADGRSRRTDEQIRRTFDRYAGRFNSAYQRALRSNPALQGTVVFTLTIQPDGSVSGVTIKSSQLDDPELERRMLVIVQTMDFTALDVEVWSGDYALNFFPG